MSEEEKSSRLKEQEKHLFIVQQERSLYNAMVGDSRKICSNNKLDSITPDVM